MAQEIRRDFALRTEAHASAGRVKPAAEETGGRSEPRQGDAAGRAGKKELTLARLREWVRELQARYGASERQVCFALQVSRSSFRYRSVAADDSALRLRLGLFSSASSLPLRLLVKGYVYIFRSIPFLMFLMLLFYGLPFYGIELGAYQAAVLALTLNHAAYIAEIVRGGISGFDSGQDEAAVALGFNRVERWMKIVLPQVLIAIVPSLVGQTILMIKDTSVLSVIGISEITQLSKALVIRTDAPFLVFSLVALVYYLLCLLLQRAARHSEKGLRRLLSGI